MVGMVSVKVRLFGPAAEAVGDAELEYALTEPARLRDLIELLMGRYPRLAAGVGTLRFAINEEYALPEAALADGDEVAVIPPVAGGGVEMVQITDGPIDAREVAARVAHRSCGAVVTFEGVVRLEGDADNPLVALEYSAYESMALRVMGRIRREALERFAIENAAIVHRVGRLAIGEASVVIVVSAGHRGDAFEACRWLIDTVKIDVPIWKKEIWSRGESTWVDPSQETSE